MTWGEIKVITLQKMFVNDDIIEVEALKELKNNDDYKVFLGNMPSVANEGIRRIYQYAYNHYKKENNEYTKVVPEKITDLTPDNYEFSMDEECCVILPLYIASELYKDDDITLATVYRNEFETALAELQLNIETPQVEVVYEM